jgi:hypothetical protein
MKKNLITFALASVLEEFAQQLRRIVALTARPAKVHRAG